MPLMVVCVSARGRHDCERGSKDNVGAVVVAASCPLIASAAQQRWKEAALCERSLSHKDRTTGH